MTAVTGDELRARRRARKYVVELNGIDYDLVKAGLGLMARYAVTNLDAAKQAEAIDRWARLCGDVKDAQIALKNARPKGVRYGGR